jgi:hypothetical protein
MNKGLDKQHQILVRFDRKHFGVGAENAHVRWRL